jgi:hypothetical protein
MVWAASLLCSEALNAPRATSHRLGDTSFVSYLHTALHKGHTVLPFCPLAAIDLSGVQLLLTAVHVRFSLNPRMGAILGSKPSACDMPAFWWEMKLSGCMVCVFWA